MGKPKLNIVLSAFACEPGRGSEQEVGWRWALELSRVFDVTVVTQDRNRAGIERALLAGAGEGRTLRFEYVQLPQPVYRLKSRFDFLTMPYYAVWQWLAMKRVSAMHSEKPFDLIHHLTFASFRVPIWMRLVGPPVVMGPVGGAERAPWQLLGYRSTWRSWMREAFRNVMTGACVRLLRVMPPLEHGNGICLAATPGMFRIFEAQGLRSRLFPTIGAEGSHSRQRSARGSDDACRFLYVGRLHLLKGVQLLLAALADARLAGCSLTIVGNGPERSRLQKQADELGLGGRVRWMGSVPRAELDAVYDAHDVLVAPSLYESGGLAVLEAMEHALPTIVLDVGGHAVSVAEGCGIKVSAESSVAGVITGLAEAMDAYARNPQRCFEDGHRARRRVEEEYGWETKVRRMTEVYREVASLEVEKESLEGRGVQGRVPPPGEPR
jgi:glycosyltransferase involved in cell wall biosynthesis